MTRLTITLALLLSACSSSPDDIFQQPAPDAATTIDASPDSHGPDVTSVGDGDAKAVQCPTGMMPVGNASCIDEAAATEADLMYWKGTNETGGITYPPSSGCTGTTHSNTGPEVSWCIALTYCKLVKKRQCLVAEWQGACQAAGLTTTNGVGDWVCPNDGTACVIGKWDKSCSVFPVNGSPSGYEKAALRCCADPA